MERKRRDRLAPERRSTHALGSGHLGRGRLSDRAGPPRARGHLAIGRRLRGRRRLRPLVGLPRLCPRPPPALLVTPDLRLHRPRRGLAAQKEFGERGPDIARRLFCAWEQFQQDGDRRRLKRTVAPLKRELKVLLRQGSKGKRHKLVRGFSKNLLKVWPALWTFTETGVEPTTTEPTAHYAGRSSTASSHSATNRTPVNAPPSGCSPPRSPAGCSGAHCSPTSPTRSALAPEATPSRCSSERSNPTD